MRVTLYSNKGGFELTEVTGCLFVDLNKKTFASEAAGFIRTADRPIKTLEFSGVAGLGVVDATRIAAALKTNTTIEELMFTNFEFSNVDVLFDAFAECPALKHITMHNCGLTDVSRLAAALSRNPSVRALQLARNHRITNTDSLTGLQLDTMEVG
jgi:hypothetical protein